MFGKLHRARKLHLTCPSCGHLQEEPSLVYSSFCRACGEHFRVRKGVALANPALKVSGITEIRTGTSKTPSPRSSEADAKTRATPDAAAGEDADAISPTDPRPEDEAEAAGEREEVAAISAGAFFGFLGEAERSPDGDDNDKTDSGDEAAAASPIGGKARDRGSLAEGSMAALMQSREPAEEETEAVPETEANKMPPNYVAPGPRRRAKASDSVPEDRVRCFRCYHVQRVSRFARSTQCERCSAYISLADYEIKTVRSHTLRTRGDITISRKGGLVNDSEIACHHLTVSGAIDALVDCSGNAVFRHSGVVRGPLYCERLVIEKNCEVRFADEVMTESAEIKGHLTGDVVCSGKVRIGRGGLLEGDLRAADLEIKEGGRVSGETVIDPATRTDLPLKKGFNPTVIG